MRVNGRTVAAQAGPQSYLVVRAHLEERGRGDAAPADADGGADLGEEPELASPWTTAR